MIELLYQEQSHSTFSHVMAALEELKEMSMCTSAHFLPEDQKQPFIVPGEFIASQHYQRLLELARQPRDGLYLGTHSIE